MLGLTALDSKSGPVSKVRDLLTRSVFNKTQAGPSNINEALKFRQEGRKLALGDKNKEKNTSNQFLTKVKSGHLVGAALMLGSTLLKMFQSKLGASKKLEDNISDGTLFGFLGGLGSVLVATFDKNVAEVNAAGSLDDLVDRYEVSANGKTKNLNKDVESEDYPHLENVILSASNKDELEAAINLSEDQNIGAAGLLRGITRCGKTLTTKAIAQELANKSRTGKAQYWYATDLVMNHSFGDVHKLAGQLLGEEPTIDKLEKIIAHAMMARGENDETPIVIVLDEAHRMLGGSGSSSSKESRILSYDKNDPTQTAPLVESLKRLISEKLSTPKCKNILLLLTANSTADQLAAPLQERMIMDLFYDKPHKEEREQMIRNTLIDEINKKNDLGISTDEVKNTNLKDIAEIGTVNLLDKFGSDDEAVRAGFGGNIEELKNRPMLNYLQLERIVRSAVIAHQKNGKKGLTELLESIKESLNKKLNSILNQKSAWKRELQFYFAT
ncbi:MAG: ATP-binding protein [Candidatus Caenarcaniphilales bacterium]|nr:ATP-binding protein [Candidatus Caenarcaniphilales bacterium]